MNIYVFVQDDPFFLPRVLDEVVVGLRSSIVGIDIQSVAQGKRSKLQTARDLHRLYGFDYFQWKLTRYVGKKIAATVINGLFRSYRTCHSVDAVARKHGIPVTRSPDVNSEAFRSVLRGLDVDLIVSISGTQFYGKALRDQTPLGIVNCHGGPLPRYRGLMPSFWMLANGETEGAVTVHFCDQAIDSGPILVQKTFPIVAGDSLEGVMARSKTLAAPAILEAIDLLATGSTETIPNDPAQATHFSMPTREDGLRFRESGLRFR